MAKKQFFAIVDTETTINDTVADFAIVICDRDGKIHNQCAVLVAGHFDAYDLFYDKKSSGIWAQASVARRRANYDLMMASGSRMLATPAAVNRWIERAIGKYDPVLTAYNLAFDKSNCANTNIDLTGFSAQFCLWQAAVGNVCNTKPYRKFCVENHLFNPPTEKRNMTFQTNAEAVAGFIAGELTNEPHTALEDARDFELPILKRIINRRDWQKRIKPYAWQDFQVKDNFVAK